MTSFAEDCRLRPPQPPRPKHRRKGTSTVPKPHQETVWPVCTVHYRRPWDAPEPERMYGCPYPPPHTQRTIDRRKKGWLPPDYGLRELQPPRWPLEPSW